MQKIHADAKQALEKAADQMKAQYDKKKRPAVEYQVGDKVWLDTTNLSLPRPKKKLADKRTGPFPIISKVGASAYKLKLPLNWRIHPVFNEALLTPYIPPAFPNQEQPPPPPPDLINGKEHYEIEKVLDSRERRVRGKTGEPWHWVTDYFVKWKGYGPESNSWVKENDMDTEELVDEYLTERIKRAEYETGDWQSYTDPFTGRKIWYDQQLDWDYFGGNDDPSTFSKPSSEVKEIP